MTLEFSSVENVFTCRQDIRPPTTHSSQGSSVRQQAADGVQCFPTSTLPLSQLCMPRPQVLLVHAFPASSRPRGTLPKVGQLTALPTLLSVEACTCCSEFNVVPQLNTENIKEKKTCPIQHLTSPRLQQDDKR